MSIDDVRELVKDLLPNLKEQVVGYAESVGRAVPDIFREARRKHNEKIARELVFFAGIKKLHWLAASSFWTLDSSGKLLSNMGAKAIRIGGADLSRGSEAHSKLENLVKDLNDALEKQKIDHLLAMSWKELVIELSSNGRRRSKKVNKARN